MLESEGPRGSTVTVGDARAKTYTFDCVFGADADQGMVYQNAVGGVLDEVLLGYNCTVFAYGQTGTGKTHTMEGDLSTYMETYAPDAGIIPRTLFRLFHVLTTRGVEHSVRMSFVELYNEELRDLLADELPQPLQGGSGGLRMFDDARGRGVVLQGLEEVPLKNAEHGLRLLRHGSQRRHIASTRCNESSSRSHCVFTLTVHVKDTSRGEEVFRVGKLNLVDLAGSENVGRSGAENRRAREAGLINQSLLTLGRVINALVDGSTHIPYRESRLTRLLQDSLGGRTKTCIIATVSDDRANIDETISTLDYALRAKSIKNRPEANQRLARAALVRDYVVENDRLRGDLAATRAKNGIYVSEEHWVALESERADLRKQVDAHRRAAEVVESRLASMHEQLEQNTAVLARREADAAVTEAQHAARIAELEQALAHAAELSTALQEETQRRQAHAQSEQQLDAVARELRSVAEQATRDVQGLFAKLQRRTDTDQGARAALVAFAEQLRGVRDVVDASAAHVGAPSVLHDAMDALVACTDAHDAMLRDAIRTPLDTLAARAAQVLATTAPEALDAGMRQLRTQLADAVDVCLGALHADYAAAVAALRTQVDAHASGVHERLGALACAAEALGHSFTRQLDTLDARAVALETSARAQAEEAARAARDERATWQAASRAEMAQLQRAVAAAMDRFVAAQDARMEATLQAHARAQRDAAAVHEASVQQVAALAGVRRELTADVESVAQRADAQSLPDASALVAEHGRTFAARIEADAAHLNSCADELAGAQSDARASLHAALAAADADIRAAIAAAGDQVAMALTRADREDVRTRAASAHERIATFAGAAHEALTCAAANVAELERSFAPLVQPAFLTGAVTGETPRRRQWTMPDWSTVPTKRSVRSSVSAPQDLEADAAPLQGRSA